MLELIIENLDGKQVATMTKLARGRYDINTKDKSINRDIEKILAEASVTGIPIRFDKRQKTMHGVKFQRFARWVKPDDEEFLEALADDLCKYGFFAYTVEISLS
jgi:hypothetical protein